MVWSKDAARYFIEEMRRYPCLYKETDGVFSSEQAMFAAWNLVALKFDVTVDICKQKWKGLKDTYKKRLKLRQTKGSAISDKIGSLDDKWVHFERMHSLFTCSPKDDDEYEQTDIKPHLLNEESIKLSAPSCSISSPESTTIETNLLEFENYQSPIISYTETLSTKRKRDEESNLDESDFSVHNFQNPLNDLEEDDSDIMSYLNMAKRTLKLIPAKKRLKEVFNLMKHLSELSDKYENDKSDKT